MECIPKNLNRVLKTRGSRAAGWFDDYIQDQGDEVMKSVILEGGVAGCAGAGKEYTDLMGRLVDGAWN